MFGRYVSVFIDVHDFVNWSFDNNISPFDGLDGYLPDLVLVDNFFLWDFPDFIDENNFFDFLFSVFFHIFNVFDNFRGL